MNLFVEKKKKNESQRLESSPEKLWFLAPSAGIAEVAKP